MMTIVGDKDVPKYVQGILLRMAPIPSTQGDLLDRIGTYITHTRLAAFLE